MIHDTCSRPGLTGANRAELDALDLRGYAIGLRAGGDWRPGHHLHWPLVGDDLAGRVRLLDFAETHALTLDHEDGGREPAWLAAGRSGQPLRSLRGLGIRDHVTAWCDAKGAPAAIVLQPPTIGPEDERALIELAADPRLRLEVRLPGEIGNFYSSSAWWVALWTSGAVDHGTDPMPTDAVEDPWSPACPPEHAARLVAAGIGLCPEHGCPLCEPRSCYHCGAAAVAVFEHEDAAAGRVQDPRCGHHGIPSRATSKKCAICDRIYRVALHRGWDPTATGYDGIEGVRCWTCGLTRETGRVCLTCQLCTAHQLPDTAALKSAAACAEIRWSGPQQTEVGYWAHRFFDRATGRWAS